MGPDGTQRMVGRRGLLAFLVAAPMLTVGRPPIEIPLRMNTASWRSVYSATVRAAGEFMVDEVTRKLGRDLVWFRRASLTTARARAVLDTVAERGRRVHEPPGRRGDLAVRHPDG